MVTHTFTYRFIDKCQIFQYQVRCLSLLFGVKVQVKNTNILKSNNTKK